MQYIRPPLGPNPSSSMTSSKLMSSLISATKGRGGGGGKPTTNHFQVTYTLGLESTTSPSIQLLW